MSAFTGEHRTQSTRRIQEILATVGPGQGFSRTRLFIIGSLAVCALFALWFWWGSGGGEYEFRVVAVRTDDLIVKVAATGTLAPVKQVEVGTEVSGIVSAVYVEENQRVKAGQILARLNPERIEAERTQAQSALVSARADLGEAQSTVTEATENYKKLKHLHELSEGLTPSQQELQAALATRERAAARETAARARIEEAKAQLAVAEINVARTVIRSPINGIVLQREVEPGQTVAASLQTPLLFLLAENLTQLVLNVAVNEADIGKVRSGQAANFTVDAFPEREFPARIVRVRYAPDSDQSATETVVTYETMLLVNNNDLLLRPGMTATAEIIVEKHEQVPVIPNAALRFTPPADQEDTNAPRRGGFFGRIFSGPPRENKNPPPASKKGADANKRTVWLLKDEQPVAVEVHVGVTDGSDTQLLDTSVLPANARIIVDMTRASEQKKK